MSKTCHHLSSYELWQVAPSRNHPWPVQVLLDANPCGSFQGASMSPGYAVEASSMPWQGRMTPGRISMIGPASSSLSLPIGPVGNCKLQWMDDTYI